MDAKLNPEEKWVLSHRYSPMDCLFTHGAQCAFFSSNIHLHCDYAHNLHFNESPVKMQSVESEKKNITIEWYITHIMNLIRNEQFEIIGGNEKFSVNLKFIVECLNDIMATLSIWQLIKKKYSQFHSIWLFICLFLAHGLIAFSKWKSYYFVGTVATVVVAAADDVAKITMFHCYLQLNWEHTLPFTIYVLCCQTLQSFWK